MILFTGWSLSTEPSLKISQSSTENRLYIGWFGVLMKPYNFHQIRLCTEFYIYLWDRVWNSWWFCYRWSYLSLCNIGGKKRGSVLDCWSAEMSLYLVIAWNAIKIKISNYLAYRDLLQAYTSLWRFECVLVCVCVLIICPVTWILTWELFYVKVKCLLHFVFF